MSDQAEQVEAVEPTEPTKNSKAEELASLRSRLDLMGIAYQPNAGIKKLRGLVAEKVEDASSPKPSVTPPPAPEVVTPYVETPGARRVRLRKEAGSLIRVVVSCMNPEKRDWEGEYFSVGNSAVGQFKKYVPFNNEQGWHVPQIVLNHMLDKECQIWVPKRNERGEKIKVAKLIKELNVQVLAPLTHDELEALGQRQAMSHSIDE